MTSNKLYRIYIDEVGDHNVKHFRTIMARYLTLFGVIVEHEHMMNVIAPEMNTLKAKYFQKDPDEPICLHRSEISRKSPPYDCLLKSETGAAVRKDFLAAYQRWDYMAIAVTIDKQAHVAKYRKWHYEPYQYCMTALMERYINELNAKKARGDTMIETRNASADRILRVHYEHLYESGTESVHSKYFQSCLTSRQLKLKPKEANIIGLQLADLLAAAAHFDLLLSGKRIEAHESSVGRDIAKILRTSKYRRGSWGKIEGYGTKILP